MMLRTYLDQHAVSTTQFAERIGVSLAALHRYLTGERTPRPEVLERISRVTQGCVQPNDFFAFSREQPAPTPEVAAG